MIHSLKASNIPEAKSCLKLILIILLSVLAISIIILSSVPPVSKDALTHHLAVPKLYIKNGGIYEIPNIRYSYYPMNLDLLYIIPLYFGNDIVPKYIHFSFAILTAWIIFTYLRKRIDTLYAIFGSLFFLSLPVIVKLSITVYVDLGLICFSTASLVYLLKWIENNFQLKYLLISGVCCGLALGTKYNALIIFFLLALFVPFIYSRKTVINVSLKTFGVQDIVPDRRNTKSATQIKAIGYGAVFILVSLLIFSPWMIKNYVWTKNPIYPLYNNLIDPVKKGQVPDSRAISKPKTGAVKSKAHLNHFALRKTLYGETGLQIALIPIRIFFEGKDGSPQYFDGMLNPMLFFLPFFAFVGLKNNPIFLRTEKITMIVFAALFILFVFFEEAMRIRWVAPAIPPLVILSTFGLHEIYSVLMNRFSPVMGKVSVVLVSFIVFLMLWQNVSYIKEQFKYVDPVSYISGRVGRDEYIERFRHEYPAIQFSNKNLSEDAKILCLFIGNRRYYSDREMVFNAGLFRRIVKQTRSSQVSLVGLKRRGITHLLVRYDLFNSWVNDNFNEREKRMLDKFFKKHVSLLFSKSNYGLFGLN